MRDDRRLPQVARGAASRGCCRANSRVLRVVQPGKVPCELRLSLVPRTSRVRGATCPRLAVFGLPGRHRQRRDHRRRPRPPPAHAPRDGGTADLIAPRAPHTCGARALTPLLAHCETATWYSHRRRRGSAGCTRNRSYGGRLGGVPLHASLRPFVSHVRDDRAGPTATGVTSAFVRDRPNRSRGPDATPRSKRSV
jgi:hypothetical protein